MEKKAASAGSNSQQNSGKEKVDTPKHSVLAEENEVKAQDGDGPVSPQMSDKVEPSQSRGSASQTVTRTVQATPNAVVVLLDWVVDGVLEESDVKNFIAFLKDAISDAVGQSISRGLDIVAPTLERKLEAKLLSLADGQSVVDICKNSLKHSKNADEVIQGVIESQDTGDGGMTQTVQDISAVLEKILPGGSIITLLVKVLKNFLPEESIEKTTLIAAVAVKYPARVYRYLRSAFTVAALHGMDVRNRCVQFEVMTVALPPLVEHLSDLVKSDHVVPAEPKSVIPDGMGMQVAGWAIGAMTGATTAATAFNLFNAAHSLYTSREKSIEQNAKELKAWNLNRKEMLTNLNDEIKPSHDVLAENIFKLVTFCGFLVLASPLYGIWIDFRILQYIIDHTLPVWLFGTDGIRLVVLLVIAGSIVFSTVTMLYHLALKHRFWKPSYIFSVIALLFRLQSLHLGYVVSQNSFSVLTTFVLGHAKPMLPSIIFIISGLSGLLENKKLTYIGRVLPFLVISLYLLEDTEEDEPLFKLQERRHTVAIAASVSGQLLLRHVLKKRSVQRRALYLFFDAVLDVFASIGRSDLDPHAKLELLTPPRPFCEAICSIITDETALATGILTGFVMQFFSLQWKIVYLIVAMITIGVLSYMRHEVPTSCWGRWKSLVQEFLPQSVEHVKYLADLWNTYLQAKPIFTASSDPESIGKIVVHLYGPRVPASNTYDVQIRPKDVSNTEGVTTDTWFTVKTLQSDELDELEEKRAEENAKPVVVPITNLVPDRLYEVKVSARGDTQEEQPDGDSCICYASPPKGTAQVVKPDERPGSLREIHVSVDCGKDFKPNEVSVKYKKLGSILYSYLDADKDSASCIIKDVVPGTSYEIMFRCRFPNGVTRYHPMESPLVVAVPGDFDDATGMEITAAPARNRTSALEGATDINLTAGVRAIYGQIFSSKESEEQVSTGEEEKAAGAIADTLQLPHRPVVTLKPIELHFKLASPSCLEVMPRPQSISPELEFYRVKYKESNSWRPWAVVSATEPKIADACTKITDMKLACNYEIQTQWQTKDKVWSSWTTVPDLIGLTPFAVGKHDYEAGSENEISFKKGANIILTRRVNDDWYEGYVNVSDTPGIFPVTHAKIIVEPIPHTNE